MPRRTALLVVDVQNDFCGGGAGEAIRAGLARLLDAARTTGVLRVFIRALYDQQYLSAPFAAQLAKLGRLGRVCQEGTPGADYWPGFAAQPGPRELAIVKHRYSAFRGTGLAETLRQHGVDTVVVAGLTLSTCVGATARDAFLDDFFVIVAADAVYDPDPARHASELAFLDRMIGTVLPSEAIAAAWAAASAEVAQ
ncbi:MAG: cysteine hydrolase [Dehalococcoidia bacterium]|nr:cysteine hydrolase [Dehalococcoidia bacterium]